MVDSSATKGNGLNDTAENIPRGGGVVPYIDYTGMCRCTRYGFQALLSRTGYRKHAF